MLDSVPSALRAERRWILWRSEVRGDKPTKVPYSVNGSPASSTNPATWAAFDDAVLAFGRGGYSGLGFVLGDGFAGIDLDGCRDADTHTLTDGARTIVDRFATYAEVSPSGTGVKIFLRGAKPAGAKSRKPGADFKEIEVYDSGRYFAVTGEAVNAHGVADCSDEFAAFCRELWPEQPTLPVVKTTGGTGGGDVLRRASQYLARIPAAVSGKNGHGQTYAAATALVHGFGLSEQQAQAMLEAEYNPRCEPPWTPRELAHKVKDAASKPHQRPHGWLRDSAAESRGVTQDQLDALGWMPGDEVTPAMIDAAKGAADRGGPRQTVADQETTDGDGRAKRDGVSNVRVDVRFFKDPNDPDKTKRIEMLMYRRIDEVSASMLAATGGWPKCAGGLLFSVRESPPGFLPTCSNVRYFGQPVDLWAWVSEACDPYWTKQKVHDDAGHPRTPATKEEFHRHLRDCAAQRYVSVSILPHYPPIPGVYYVPCELPTSTGKRLAEFLDMLNPDTEADRQLMLACLLTMLWGGPMGGRPMFVFDSKYGRGCIAGETLIENPDTGESRTVESLWKDQRPIRVWTRTKDGRKIAADASAPWIKGIHDLYEVTTENGSSIRVTPQHRFLTPTGWRTLSDLRAGCHLACAEDRVWSRIVSIKFVRRDVFYDLEVPGTANYLAHGIWNHNSGKTATAEALAAIVGGAFRIEPDEDWETVKKRLMSDRAMGQRAVLLDNVKKRLGGPQVEGIITASTIDGWRPYHGNFSRPNDLTWLVTQNSARGSQDVATRAVIIHIGPQRHGESFIARVAEFIESYRAELIADLLALLSGPARGVVSAENRDRFQAWQDGPLSRCDDPDGLAALIIERRGDLDSDSEEAEEVASAVRAWVAANKPPRDQDGRAKITRDQMRGLLLAAKVIDEGMGKRGVYSWILNMLGANGPLSELSDSRASAGGDRVWLWSEKLDIPV